MKTPTAGMAAQFASRAQTIAVALRVTRPDAQVFGFTSATHDATISGVPYESKNGIDLSSFELSAGLDVDNIELTTLDDSSVFTHADVLSRKWSNSKFLLFRYNWANVADGIDPIMGGVFSEVVLKRTTVVVELFGLQFYLQHPTGPISTKLCRNRLGVDDGVHSFCNVNLAPFTHSGTVTAVANPAQFTDSALVQPDDYFGEGTVLWLTGNNAGLTMLVKAFASGAFTLTKPMLAAILIGDTFEAIAGCRKRLDLDCKIKFNNVPRFKGEWYRPKPADVLKQAEP
jgi:uncharacterized phage protein (TIGR02218 family)